MTFISINNKKVMTSRREKPFISIKEETQITERTKKTRKK